ncbi:MAG TPA: hypothetical protein DEP71_11040 [Porphyromonadaceae bacterium]|nr:hypothetical protein [Porphyromonadaceae bacterium]HBF95502.1 hypothetical protein [Porphyromonadaceae bacterium]HBG80090.1 hypothetical protein [Porphyromonadaceae bacterium]HBK41598.1 hypothetical protein [Porphyromonadaceae bacterium]HBK93634.1 hypothetical protein [Porphyromonadaceae bacterium]
MWFLLVFAKLVDVSNVFNFSVLNISFKYFNTILVKSRIIIKPHLFATKKYKFYQKTGNKNRTNIKKFEI